MSTFVDYYRVLGVEPSADLSVIKSAYRAIAKRLHPDAFPDVDFTEEELKKMRENFTLVNDAYEVLRDEESRGIYDVKYNLHQKHVKRQEELRKQEEEERIRKQQEKDFEDIERMFRKAQEEKKARERQQEQAYQEQEEVKQTNSANETFYEVDPFWTQMKREYRRVRREEKKEPFRKRHSDIEDMFYDVYGEKVDSIPKEILYHTAKGTVHVFTEAFYQLRKLRINQNDSASKYVLRNRRLIATALAAGIIFSSGLFEPKTQEEPLAGTSIEITDAVEEEPITMYRIYKVKGGDTLSELAVNAHSTIDEIKAINHIPTNTIYIGETFKIPYNIEREDLEYYTQSVNVQDRSLEELAETFSTDVRTLYELNKESIQKMDSGSYIIMSNKVLVPNFITRTEYNNIKGISYYK